MQCPRLLLLHLLSLGLWLGSATGQTYDGYTLYAKQGDTKAYLLDMTGTVYKTWTFSSSKPTGYSTYLLPGGTLLRTVANSPNSFTGGGITGAVQKVDWNGNVTWNYIYSTTAYCCHHDVHPMPNGNVLLIAYEKKTAAEVVQAGCSQSIEMWPEKIVEVQPSGTLGGTIVWEWHVWDHLCQTYNSAKSNYVTSILAHPELININYNTSKDWMHANGIDYNPDLDQIVFSSHMLNEVYVIDHSTTTAQAATHTGGNSGKGGDILYRWGNPAAYQASGTTIFNVVHDAHWIPSTHPTYPNSLCAFNNKGGTSSKSCSDIFTPPYNGYTYSHTAGTAYSPSTYTWRHTYSGVPTQDMGNSQHLPNGNTLMCLSQSGYLYEINPAQTVVWSKTISGNAIPQAFRYPPCYITGTFAATATAASSSVCQGETTQLGVTVSGGTAYTYAWTSSPSGFTSSQASPTVSPTVTTVYPVTITNGPCSASSSVTVMVNPKPAAATGSNRSICQGQTTQIGATAVAGNTYLWTSFPSGFSSTTSNPTVSPTETTLYTLVETVTATGCFQTNTVTVTVNSLPSANAGSSSSGCIGNSVQIGAAAVPGTTCSWTSVPAGFYSVVSNPVVTPAVTTTYTLVETVTATGCSNSNPVTVTVNPLPEAYTGPKQSVCQGEPVQLGTTAVAGNTYSWTSDPPGFTSTLSNPVVTPLESTQYFLTETNTATNCTQTNNVQINVNPLPLPADSISGPETVQQGETGISYSVPVIVHAAGYQWSLPPGATITAGDSTQSITVDFGENAVSGPLSVSGYNACGNGSSFSLNITVESTLPAQVSMSDTVLLSGETACFNATQTLTLGGDPGVSVDSGGSVSLIAGGSILLEPSTLVQPGGYLYGYITTTGDHCPTVADALTAATVTDVPPAGGPETGLFRAYPNPARGRFTLEYTGEAPAGPFRAQLITLQGQIVFSSEYDDLRRTEIVTGNLSPGIYILRVLNDSAPVTLKIALTHCY